MHIQRTALKVFFPAMFLCAGFALAGVWLEDAISESIFKLIPTFFIIGFASCIVWSVSVIVEFLNIARNKK